MRETDEIGGPKQTGWRPSTQDNLVRSGEKEGAMQNETLSHSVNTK